MSVRLFGWVVLACLVAFLTVNVLNVGFAVPNVFHGGLISIGVYVVCLAIAALYVLRNSSISLRQDAERIHNANIFILRFCFWAVLLVGVTDILIAFMRTENLLTYFVSEGLSKELIRAKFVGTYIHLPLILAGLVLAFFTRTLGFTWLALLIVIAELLIVISRFVFSYEQAFMADLVRYWYAALFLFSSAYTLYEEGHVRVDVLYAGFKGTTRGYVNAFGSLFLGMTTCWVILFVGFNGKSSIINSPVINFEVTQTGSVGMFVKYQMAAFLGIFASTMLIEFVAYFFEAVADFREEPGKREVAPVSH